MKIKSSDIFKNTDLLFIFETVLGLFLLGIAIYGVYNAFIYFSDAWGQHFGPRMVTAEDVRPYWVSALTSSIRMIFIAFIGGILTTHGLIGIFGEETMYSGLSEGIGKIYAKIKKEKKYLELFTDDISLVFELNNKAPVTCEKLLNKTPTSSKAIPYQDDVFLLEVDIEAGPENQRRNIKPGMLGFIPNTKSICLSSAETRLPYPFNYIGDLKGDVNKIKWLKEGEIEIRRFKHE